ncbi:hypothetical protein [Herbiconiux solani]|uniref:hypothetical protein n=1 Tax=Herbiconiux solani TaxID=661329 RepID=UPI000825B2CE|nr:hypothetical protein [Herbiconiux solani]
MRRLFAASIWAHGAIPVDEWKYRNLKRVWLPLYDLLAMWAGVNAVVFGSRLLNRLLSEELLDLVGIAFTVVAAVCLLAVAFPRLWAIEMVGKSLLVGMVFAYMASVILYPTPSPDETPNWFIVAMLGFGLPLALFRLTMLGEEWKERHKEQESDA